MSRSLSTLNWEEIRARYESGEGPQAISKSLGGRPTRQAIHQRANKEGWEKVDGFTGTTVTLPQEFAQDLSDEQSLVIAEILNGATQSEAAGKAMITQSAISNWKKRHPFFVKALAYAEAVKKGRRRSVIETSPDPKDARWLLERDPSSRDDYGATQVGAMIGNTFNILGRLELGIERERVAETVE